MATRGLEGNRENFDPKGSNPLEDQRLVFMKEPSRFNGDRHLGRPKDKDLVEATGRDEDDSPLLELVGEPDPIVVEVHRLPREQVEVAVHQDGRAINQGLTLDEHLVLLQGLAEDPKHREGQGPPIGAREQLGDRSDRNVLTQGVGTQGASDPRKAPDSICRPRARHADLRVSERRRAPVHGDLKNLVDQRLSIWPGKARIFHDTPCRSPSGVTSVSQNLTFGFDR